MTPAACASPSLPSISLTAVPVRSAPQLDRLGRVGPPASSGAAAAAPSTPAAAAGVGSGDRLADRLGPGACRGGRHARRLRPAVRGDLAARLRPAAVLVASRVPDRTDTARRCLMVGRLSFCGPDGQGATPPRLSGGFGVRYSYPDKP